MTRIGLMRLGAGDRFDSCRHYDECLRAAALADVVAHCPPLCAFRSDVSLVERVAEHLDGLRESPNCEEEGDKEDKRTPRGALRGALIAALSSGESTTRRLSKATGFAMASITGRMADLERAGLIRRVGVVRETPRSSARSVVWALAERKVA